MIATVIVVVATHNVAIGIGIGIGVGVLVAMVMFARRVAHFVTVERTVKTVDGHETATYVVDGKLFFASSNDLYTQFEYALDPEHVIIDMHASRLWDASTVAALDAITEKYRRHGTDVKVIGLNDASTLMRERLGGKLGAGHSSVGRPTHGGFLASAIHTNPTRIGGTVQPKQSGKSNRRVRGIRAATRPFPEGGLPRLCVLPRGLRGGSRRRFFGVAGWSAPGWVPEKVCGPEGR
jgi:MFS superfamily sulfate permease-like transporter